MSSFSNVNLSPYCLAEVKVSPSIKHINTELEGHFCLLHPQSDLLAIVFLHIAQHQLLPYLQHIFLT